MWCLSAENYPGPPTRRSRTNLEEKSQSAFGVRRLKTQGTTVGRLGDVNGNRVIDQVKTEKRLVKHGRSAVERCCRTLNHKRTSCCTLKPTKSPNTLLIKSAACGCFPVFHWGSEKAYIRYLYRAYFEWYLYIWGIFIFSIYSVVCMLSYKLNPLLGLFLKNDFLLYSVNSLNSCHLLTCLYLSVL